MKSIRINKGGRKKGCIPWNKGKTLEEMYPDVRERAAISKKLSERSKINYRKKTEFKKVCRQCGKGFITTRARLYCHNPCNAGDDAKNHLKATVKKVAQKVKKNVLSHYSNGNIRCACCGEKGIEFLTLDHINRDGKKHREQVGSKMYYWLIRNNFPKGFRVFCFNCNMASFRNNGICPHNK